MNVSQIYGNRQNASTPVVSVNQSNNIKADLKGKRDSVEISATAYKKNAAEDKMTATSGKDTLGITKGDKDNSFVIHFSDSAMVSRAVSRGYITVNGIELQLSDKTKRQLLKADEQAKAEREKAYKDYVMQHEMAVAKQQSETLKKAFGNMANAADIATKISNGDKVSSDELKKLMEINPQLFLMAQSTKTISKQYENASKAYGNMQDGVSWSQFEWKAYDTQMEIFIDDSIKIENISKGEVLIG
jgi:hypothetical protein